VTIGMHHNNNKPRTY